MDLNKVNKLLENKDFFEKISEMKNAEDVMKTFKEKGVELSIEDIKELERMNHKAIEEMNEEGLENVSGGRGEAYHFREGINDALMPNMNESFGTVEPKTKTQKIFRKMGKVFAWTVLLPVMPITRLIDAEP